MLLGAFGLQVAIIMGSGCGGIAKAITDAVTISYADIPGFPVSTVSGHAGTLEPEPRLSAGYGHQ